MRWFVFFLTGCIATFVVTFVLTQIVFPALRGTKLFPWCCSNEPHLEKEYLKARQDKREQVMRDIIREERNP